MYLQAVELWSEKWLNKKTTIPIALLFLMLVVLIVISGARLIDQWEDEVNSTDSSVESWKITNTVCAPTQEIGDNIAIDWGGCFQSTLVYRAAINVPDGWIDLPDGHQYKPLFAYECFPYGDVSSIRLSDSPNLFDLMFADVLPENGCKWSCDPTHEAECRQ